MSPSPSLPQCRRIGRASIHAPTELQLIGERATARLSGIFYLSVDRRAIDAATSKGLFAQTYGTTSVVHRFSQAAESIKTVAS